ncbi:MAG TPA: response regulator transcription factor [Leptospiraceae bacterium]|nr:response regulator transcription factor [Leptospiraceae bacterium]HNI97007.1 response regulator transcription factor [Leptospiraceae bacterium]HNN05471.1 response regulator transcription factor [Leptospiraceae bacterium]
MKKSSDEFMKKSLRIGLVENDLEFRETTEVKLQSISSVSKIYAWSSAEEYLREKNRPVLDIIFLDIMLPYKNGVDLALEISNENPETIIIMLTNMNSDALIFESIKNGALGYILKSELGTLENIIQTVVEGGAVITPTIALRVFASFRKDRPKAPEMTDRERQVLELLVRGKSVLSVAKFLDLSIHTVQGYVKAIYKKLNVHNRAELSQKANQLF